MSNSFLVIAFTALYIVVTVIATELFDFSARGGGALEFKRFRAAQKKVKTATVVSDVESGKNQELEREGSSASSDTLDGAGEEEALKDILGSDSIFTWENLEYTVLYRGGSWKLLNKVHGFAKPDVMVALMELLVPARPLS
jgi:hypothetical protein